MRNGPDEVRRTPRALVDRPTRIRGAGASVLMEAGVNARGLGGAGAGRVGDGGVAVALAGSG